MKKNAGITIVALVIIVVILLILASVSVGAGSRVITASQLENLKTDMMLIQAKGKECVEKANFNLGTGYEKVTDENEKTTRLENAKSALIGTEIANAEDLNSNLGITSEKFEEDKNNMILYYKLSTQNLENASISDVKSDKKNGEYIIRYDIKNISVEIYNTKGFEKDKKTYYSLSEIQNLNV